MSGKKKQKQKSPKVKRVEPKVKPRNGDVSMKGSLKDKWSATKTVYTRPR